MEKPLIIDVGTGSGAIAISLAAEIASGRVIASELSAAALRVARENSRRLCQTPIDFLQADLLTPLSAQFNLICANLPYIPSGTLKTLETSRWEPALALDGGENGLDSIQRLLKQSISRLAPQGVILLEIEASQGSSVLALAKEMFPNAQSKVIRDLSGRDRIVEIQQI